MLFRPVRASSCTTLSILVSTLNGIHFTGSAAAETSA